MFAVTTAENGLRALEQLGLIGDENPSTMEGNVRTNFFFFFLLSFLFAFFSPEIQQ